jgi:hypothetical protein
MFAARRGIRLFPATNRAAKKSSHMNGSTGARNLMLLTSALVRRTETRVL